MLVNSSSEAHKDKSCINSLIEDGIKLWGYCASAPIFKLNCRNVLTF
jgi:hypothetical protein